MKEARRHLLLDGRWCALRERERRLRNAADVIADPLMRRTSHCVTCLVVLAREKGGLGTELRERARSSNS